MPLAYDDDDYLPPSRSADAPGQNRKRSLVVLGVVGIAIGAFALIVILRARRATEEARAVVAAQERHAAEAMAPIPIERPTRKELRTRPAASAPRGNPGDNWQAAIGTWRREVVNENDAMPPVEFVFRQNFTSRVLHQSPTVTVIRETLVEVRLDEGNTLEIVFHEQDGWLKQRFRVMEDGTLILDGYATPLIYTRMK